MISPVNVFIRIVGYYQSNVVVALYYDASRIKACIDKQLLGIDDGSVQNTQITRSQCCKGDHQSQWERVNFDPQPTLNPLTDRHQI